MPWPHYDRIFRVSSSQEEGCERRFNILTKQFQLDQDGRVKGIEYVEVKWDESKKSFKEQGKTMTLKTDLVFLAMGFIGAEKSLLEQFGLGIDHRGRIPTRPGKDYAGLCQSHVVSDNPDVHTLVGYTTLKEKVFAAGDARRGQSLVVWAISEGRECAREVDGFLRKRSTTIRSKHAGVYSEGFLPDNS